jgi:MacB-like periplasmic core domain
MESVSRHIRHAVRQLRRQPGFSLTVVVTLGLAIGANTAIFSFVNALLIRPFPFRDAGRLVEIHSIRGGQQGKMSMVEVLDIKQQVTVLENMAAHSGGAGGYNYSGEGRPEEWRAVLTTGNLFEVLGVPFEMGKMARHRRSASRLPRHPDAWRLAAQLWRPARRRG